MSAYLKTGLFLSLLFLESCTAEARPLADLSAQLQLESTIEITARPAAATRTACSYQPVTFTFLNSSGASLTIPLSVSGSAKAYRDAQCTTPTSSLYVPAGSSSRSVYIKDSSAETVTVSATLFGTVASAGFPVYGATNVAEYGASGSDLNDDSAAFTAAIAAAETAARDFPIGPPLDAKGTTRPQAIIYVPSGTYHLSKVYLKSNVRLEIDANAVLKGGADPAAKCLNLLLLDTPNSSTLLASQEKPIKNVSVAGVGTATDDRKAVDGWDISHSFTLDDDPTHQICAWKTDAGGVLTSSVIPPQLMVRNVTGFLLENLYSVQTYAGYPLTGPGGNPNEYPTNVIVFQSGVGGNFEVVKGAGGTTQYPLDQQTPDTEFTHPRWGIYRNHVNINAPAGYGPAQFQSGENITVEGIYSKGGVALRLETDVAGNGQDPDSFPKSPCKNYTGTGPDYRCQAWGAKLEKVHATKIKCVNGNAGVYLVAHGQLNGAVSVSDVTTENCYTGITESANSLEWKNAGDPHLLVGTFRPNFIGIIRIGGSTVDANQSCVPGGCRAQHPCSQVDTFIPKAIALSPVSISPSATWGSTPDGLELSGYFSEKSLESCPAL